ncbi:MAG: hypothetical protein D6B28_03680 [Gammaproteobacteria bacterium]|nr:MAG: hypothetical protein D6B28_03680 [Gammaproteobacteria bacterium]
MTKTNQRIISLICMAISLANCSNDTIPAKKTTITDTPTCKQILHDFFVEYDAVIRSRDINKLENYIDNDSRRWGMGKPGIIKRVRNNFGVIKKYDVTIKQCKYINEDIIHWEGFAEWGIGVTQHSMGTGLVRKDGKWRMRVIEYRP